MSPGADPIRPHPCDYCDQYGKKSVEIWRGGNFTASLNLTLIWSLKIISVQRSWYQKKGYTLLIFFSNRASILHYYHVGTKLAKTVDFRAPGTPHFKPQLGSITLEIRFKGQVAKSRAFSGFNPNIDGAIIGSETATCSTILAHLDEAQMSYCLRMHRPSGICPSIIHPLYIRIWRKRLFSCSYWRI